MKRTKRSLLNSVTALMLCISMLLGTTYAWFTDSATSTGNIIQSGNLDIGMYWSRNNVDWLNAEGGDANPIFSHDNWEPGYTEVRYIKVTNDGNLAFKYRMLLEPNGDVSQLAEVIDVSYDIVTGNDNFVAPNASDKHGSLTKVGTLNDLISNNGIVAGGVLLPESQTEEGYYSGEIVVCIAFHMQENAGNEYQNLSIGTTFGISLYATQFDFESDSFDNQYDAEAQWPENIVLGNTASATVTTDSNGLLTSGVSMTSADGKIMASLPAGVQLDNGVSSVTLNVANIENSQANITLSENEQSLSIDVHILGVSESNTTVMGITVKELLPVGLNMGNYRFYHVEDGQTVEMTLLGEGETAAHNSFEYDPATGDVVLYLASFSEVALVAEPAKWEGNLDYSWYKADATEYYISNADQLAAFGAIVGGMKKVTGRVDGVYTYSEEVIQDSFAGKTVKLLADINIGDTNEYYNDASENGIVFYPIGYWNSDMEYEKHHTGVSSGFYTFNGTFDGNGHKISNFYQNTWEMKGDHDWYAATDEYYRDGMGLFGRVYGGTVKNLTVENFSSDGEITTTGTIAAYADNGALFENIAIVGCNPRVYNIGNGGIVGCVGWYNKNQNDTTPVTFRNITVDNTNKISALWGSWDVACGGIVGQYYPTSGQSSANYPKNAGMHFENCHAGAQIDVYNDVCANYQYYAYRYAGILVGSVRENETINGHSYPKMDGITASGCTVHFGDWNDYYYCELVANTTASYTHDHQMSRLEQIAAINVAEMKYQPLDSDEWLDIPSGRVNYVIVNAKDANGKWIHGDGHDYAECYHFVNGVQHLHDVADADNPNIYETVNGETVLKEDKQLIYREFNNLVTGYGWGVTSKGVGDMAGVTKLDRTQANSVVKFESNLDENTLKTNTPYNIGSIFSYIADCGVSTIPGSLTVTVTNLDENGNVVATFDRASNDWKNGVITFSNTGKVRITIQDYFFCTSTSIDVDVVEESSGGSGSGSGSTTTTTKWEYYRNNSNVISGNTDKITTNGTGSKKDSYPATIYTEANPSGETTIRYTQLKAGNTFSIDTNCAGELTIVYVTDKDTCTFIIDGDTTGKLTKNKITTVTVSLKELANGEKHIIQANSNNQTSVNIAYISFTFEETTPGAGPSEPTAHEHNFKGVVTNPTCTGYGYTTYTCECKHSYVSNEVAATGHAFDKGVCSGCGALDPNYGEVHTHSYTEKITKNPDCTNVGEKIFTCECGHSYTEVIAALGHTPGAAASCTTAQTCTVCKAVIKGALGHNFVNGTCTICHTTTTTTGKEIHNFTANGKDSSFYTISGNLSTGKGTVTYDGLTLTQCLKIESSTSIKFTAQSAGTLTLVFAESSPTIKVNGTKMTGSNGVITVDIAAGEVTITKADVANLFYMVYTPSNVHTHSYTETITQAASCTNTGLKTLECSCGDTKTEVIAKLAHSYTETVTKQATCTEEGTITIACSTCTETKYESIPMTEHNWVSGDCNASRRCTSCNATQAGPGHTWVDATCTAPKTCSVCNATEGLALGHSYTTATCASPAKCTRCGITSGSTAAHTPGADATCTTAQTCTVCKTVLTAALGHNYVNNKCTRCGVAKPSESFKSFDGWFETAYAEWTDIAGADGYNAYVAVANSTAWTQVDSALVRKTNGYWRVDAVGLTAGSYQIKVIPTKSGNELLSDTMTTDVINVTEYDRSGYAHYNYTEGVGAYKDDGTLKDNAIVIYVTNENKNTVTVTSKDGTTVTGIGNILGSTGMDVGTGLNSKGGKANTNQDILRKLAEDGTPLVIRIVGSVKGASSTNLSTAVSEIDGLTAYDSVDYGGSVGDNGFMARMSGGKNITIEGIGTDATIDGWGIHFICSTADYKDGYGRSFEVRNITFKNVPEDCVGMEGQQEGSTLTAPVERCWIHNCSFIAPTITSPAESDKDGGDGACDFKRGNYFTNSYCYYEGYHKTNLVGSSDSSLQYHLTYHHNYWKNCDSRGPLARNANIHMYNNIFDVQTSYCMNPRANAYIFSEYNLFINSKNPVDVASGGVKSYNDSFTSCTGTNNATIVTDKSTQVSTSNKYANFDTNASISYIPSGDYELQESITGMKAVVMAYTGVMKQVIVEPDEVNTSVIPADRMPTAAVVLNYSQSLNKNYVSSNGTKDNIKFNVSKFNTDSLTVGGTANGCDIVFYVDSNVNISMTEVSGTNHPILCNAAGETIIVGNGSAENLPAGYYFIQSSVYDPGSGKFKEAKIASLTIERAITCTNHTYTSKVTAPTCTSKGYTTYTCTNCGYSYQGNETAVAGHTPGAAATCTTAQTCTVCNTVITKALGHSDANADGKCDRCGLFDPATCKHTNTTAVVTAPTCTKTGYTTYTCKDCGNVSTGNQTPATGHIGGIAATCTTAQTCTVCSAVVTVALGHNYVNNKCTRCNAEKPTSNFIEVGGWFETAYAEWAPMAGVDGYAAYVTTAGSSSWIHLDNYLIRQYNGYWRVDAVGLAAGNYQIRVVPVIGENENASLAITSENITVQAHDRSGYAFVNGTSSGAYNENGTLKTGAVVIYVTEQNKNTVEATIDGKTYTGLSNILASSVLKTAKSPICVRFIGNITDLGTGSAFDKGDLLIDNSHNTSGLTLEGIGKDAVINGFGIRLKNSSNVEIRNLAVMNCDSNEGDNIGLQQANDHVWVHNCDFFYGHAGSDADQAKGDGQLDTKKSTYVTHSYNHFWDGGKVHLQGNKGDTSQFITYHHNWYDHCDSRMPRVRVADSIHVYNNFYDGISKYGIGATTGCSIFSEANYFLNVNAPMMISKQGTDAMGDGTFSGEDGGMIKSYGDVMVGCKSFIPYSQNNTSFDAYVASSRNEKLPSSVVTLSGGTAYSNFDTDAGFYSYNVQSAEEARVTVQNYAGRMNGGDFPWEFTDADNTSSAVNQPLKDALVGYTSSIVSIGGVKE